MGGIIAVLEVGGRKLEVRGEEAKRQRGKEAKRQRGEEAKRQRGKEAKRQRGKEAGFVLQGAPPFLEKKGWRDKPAATNGARRKRT